MKRKRVAKKKEDEALASSFLLFLLPSCRFVSFVFDLAFFLPSCSFVFDLAFGVAALAPQYVRENQRRHDGRIRLDDESRRVRAQFAPGDLFVRNRAGIRTKARG